MEMQEKLTLRYKDSREYECPTCFILWEEETRDVVFLGSEQKECEYCSTHTMTDRELLARRISHLDNTLAYRFPIILQQLYNNMTLKDL